MLRKGYPVTNVYLFKNKLWLDEFSTRMHEWLEGNKRPPIKIDAELHRRCNLDCMFCIRRNSDGNMSAESREIEVDNERWLEIARQSGEMGVKGWNISGIGEPMCKPDLTISLMEIIKSYDMFGEITTNGTLWDDEMIKKTVDMNWDSVCVSLDSPERMTHNKLRGDDKAFEKTLKTIYKFNKYKQETNSKLPTLTINVVLNKLNYKQLPDLFLLAHDLGVDSIFVEPMINYGETSNKLKMNSGQIEEFKEISDRCKKMAKDLGIEPNINCYTENQDFDENLIDNTSEMKDVIESDSESKVEEYKDPDKNYTDLTDRILNIPCYYPWFYMIVTASGRVSHCGEKVDKIESIKDRDLDEIWYGEEFENYRDRFLDGDLPEYCNRCRPNVVGDARRIRKSITELRDKEYIIDSISDVRYTNRNIEDRIDTLQNYEYGLDTEDCGESCKYKERLERIKEGNLYKLSKKLSSIEIGKKIKKKYHHGNGTMVSQELELEEMTLEKLREILWEELKRNKKLKDRLYNLKNKKNVYRNVEKMCEHKKELLELKDSLLLQNV